MRLSAVGTWVRLWAPELAAGTVGALGTVHFLHPIPPGPMPGLADPTFGAWWDGLVWPPPATIAVTAAVGVGICAAVAAIDILIRQNKRRARLLRHRWETSPLGKGSRLRRIRVNPKGVVTARCTLRDGNWDGLRDKLDPNKGAHLRDLYLGRRWGCANRASFSRRGHLSPARTQTIRLFYRPLGNAWRLPTYEQPIVGTSLVVGEGFEGPVSIDLGKAPHFEIVGGTGSGKGIFIKGCEIQALRAGWLGVTIDGGNSPEHGPLLRAPTWLVPMADRTLDEAGRLQAAIDTLDMIHQVARRREHICDLFDVDTWAQLPADVKAWQRPVAVIVDEATTLLAKEKDPEMDALRATLAQRIDTKIIRNGRKFGVHVLPISDQFAYSGVFSKAAAMQAEGRVVLGNLASEHVRQATGLASLPVITEDNLAGHYVRFGDPDSVTEIRLYPNDREALKRAVDCVRGET